MDKGLWIVGTWVGMDKGLWIVETGEGMDKGLWIVAIENSRSMISQGILF